MLELGPASATGTRSEGLVAWRSLRSSCPVAVRLVAHSYPSPRIALVLPDKGYGARALLPATARRRPIGRPGRSPIRYEARMVSRASCGAVMTSSTWSLAYSGLNPTPWYRNARAPQGFWGARGFCVCSAVSYFSTRVGSIIGAGRLSFRVRDGSGRFPVAVAAVTLLRCVVGGGVQWLSAWMLWLRVCKFSAG